ncbi:MAG: hypothetical protein RLZZ611_1780 [Cyanobacteriota bacterium]
MYGLLGVLMGGESLDSHRPTTGPQSRAAARLAGHSAASAAPDSAGTSPPPPAVVSLEAEVPEALFEGMRAFLQNRPDWDQYRVMTSALAGFLFQNGCSDRCVAQHYLNGLFMRSQE